MVKYEYVIQKVPQRSVENIIAQIPEAHIVEDDGRGAMATLMRCYSEYPGNAIHFEDDAILCRDFKRRADGFIQAFPGSVIQFMTGMSKDIKLGWRAGAKFSFSVAYYMPAVHRVGVYDFYHREWDPKRKAENPTGLDTVIADYLKSRKLQYFCVVPNLVQHNHGETAVSVINSKRNKNRRSPLFIDDMEADK